MGGKQSGKNRAAIVGADIYEDENRENPQGPVPQSAFVIGGDDDDEGDSPTPGPATVPQTGENTTMQPMQQTPREMMIIESVKREPLYVGEKNRSKID